MLHIHNDLIKKIERSKRHFPKSFLVSQQTPLKAYILEQYANKSFFWYY